MRKNSRNNKRYDIKNKVINRQICEIENLKQIISDLEISCVEKDKIINSIDVLREDFYEVLDDLKCKNEEYNKLISELIEMRNTMNQIVFKRKWKLIKLLLR